MAQDKEKKIHCANCKNCKVVIAMTSDGVSTKKVRCAAGHWRKKLGAEKLFALKTVHKRIPPDNTCPDYDEMGETRAYMKELKKNLPFMDGGDVYTVD